MLMTSRMFADDSVYEYEMEEVDAMQEQRRGTTRKEEDKKGQARQGFYSGKRGDKARANVWFGDKLAEWSGQDGRK
jgi:hypothetical protein